MARFLQNGWGYRLRVQCGASIGPSDNEYHELSHMLPLERVDDRRILLMVQNCDLAHSIKSRVVQNCDVARERVKYE